MRSYQTRKGFWREAIAVQGSVTVQIIPSIISFGLLASIVCWGAWFTRRFFGIAFAPDISPFGFVGAVLGILLVIRLNAGYDRWWEARNLWGGIVNQSRNLGISAITYGPHDLAWQNALIRWIAIFPHVARHSLRGEPPSTGLTQLIGDCEVKQLAAANHMPSFVAWRIGLLLREATEQLGMNGFSFMQIDRQKAMLMDHIGACERILATPLPRIYSITIRRFILLFLVMLPLGLIQQAGAAWHTPVITMLVAYPLLTLDQIGVELENPFSSNSLSHLPLDDISANIERNLLAVLTLEQTKSIEKTSAKIIETAEQQ
ncbi:bestrophin family protein [Pirellulaceae bacterium SH449]